MKFFFALLGVALAAQSSLLPRRPFDSQKHYIYRYDAAIISGLPIEAESSVTRIQADVHFQWEQNGYDAVMIMKNVYLAAAHMEDGERMPQIESLEKRELSSEHQKVLELPVAFLYKEGRIVELQFEMDEQPWSANIKRGVLNMLQTSQHESQGSLKMESDEDWKVYTATEKTIEGECEVVYSIFEEAEETNVKKAINFDKCTRNLTVSYGYRFEKNTMDLKEIVPQTVYNFKISKDQFKEITVRSTYTHFFKDESTMQTQTNGRLTLVEVSDSRLKIQLPSGKKGEILYSNEYEKNVEQFFKQGEKEITSPFASYTSKIEVAKEIVDQMKEQEESSASWVHLMARLVRVFRMSSVQDLNKFHDMICKSETETTKILIRKALAIAGTRNTIEHLLRHIEDKEVSTKETFFMFKSIQETQFPSEEIANLVLRFARGELARSQPILRQAAWLCYGSIVRGIVSPSQEEHLFIEKSNGIKKKFQLVMEELLEQADDISEKILALKVIANSGLDLMIHSLEKLIWDRREETKIRVEAIQALRIMAEQMPRKIQRLLMPVLSDRKEKTEIRAAAFERIIYTLPEHMIVSQIVDIIENDPNQQLTHFIFSFLKACDSTDFTSERHMIHDIQIALKKINFKPKKVYLSMYEHFPWYSQKWMSGAHINIAAIFGKDSEIPKDMYLDFETMNIGRWSQYLGQMGFSHQNFEQILRKIYSQLENLRGERNEKRVNEGINLVKKLAEKMNIKLRRDSTETPFAMIYLRYKQMDFAFLPIDEKTIDEMVEKYVSTGKFDGELLENFLRQNMNLDATTAAFFFETTKRFPTALGIPHVITAKMPTVITGQLKIKTERVSHGFRLRIEGKPVIATTVIYQMRTWIPIFESGVKIVRTARFTIPMDMDLEYSQREKHSFTLHFKTPESEENLANFASHPVAFLRFPNPSDISKYTEIEENSIVIPGWEKKVQAFNRKVEFGGLTLWRTGHKFPLWTPKEILFGTYNYDVIAKRSHNGPADIAFHFDLGFYADIQMDTPELVEKKDPRVHQLVEEITRTSKKGNSWELVGYVEANNRINFRMIFKGARTMQYFIINTELNAPTNDMAKWEWEQKIEMLFPRRIGSIKELKEKDHVATIAAATHFGDNRKNEVITSVILEQTPVMKNWIHSIMREMPGMDEWELLQKASILDHIRMDNKYSISQNSEAIFQMGENIVQLWGYARTERIQGVKDHVFANITIDPATRQYLNLTLEAPTHRLIERLWIPFKVPVFPLTGNKWSSPKEIVFRMSECEIRGNKINTFDSVVYRAPLSNCFTLIAKDCSEEARYAVLLKTESSEKKVLKFVRGSSEYIIQMVHGKMQVTRNGKMLPEEEYEQHNIELVNSKLIVITLKEIIIGFDGKALKVQADSSEKNTQCGMCGNHDGDKSTVFRTASDEDTEDLEEFHKSYLEDEECKIEHSVPSKHYKIYDEREYEYETENIEEEKPRKRQDKKTKKQEKDIDSEEEEIEPKMANLVVEHSNTVCISTEPIETCPKNSRPIKEQLQKVKMVCLPRHKPETRRMVKEVRHKPQPLKTPTYTKMEQMSIPQSCKAY